MNTVTLAQFGCGYWGPNLLRNFSTVSGCRVRYVVDPSAERRAFVETNFPQVKAVASVHAVLEDPAVNAIVIATPAETHFRLAKKALRAGNNAFFENTL